MEYIQGLWRACWRIGKWRFEVLVDGEAISCMKGSVMYVSNGETCAWYLSYRCDPKQ